MTVGKGSFLFPSQSLKDCLVLMVRVPLLTSSALLCILAFLVDFIDLLRYDLQAEAQASMGVTAAALQRLKSLAADAREAERRAAVKPLRRLLSMLKGTNKPHTITISLLLLHGCKYQRH
jgi:hypothetical protein